MATQSVCPRCGSPLTVGQRFCATCGLVVDESANKSTEYTPEGENQPSFTQRETQYSTPPPPPPEMYMNTPAPGALPQQGYQAVPPVGPVAGSYAPPVKDSSRSVMGQIGCGMLVVILLILGLCGAISYGAYAFVSNSVSKTASSYDRVRTPSTQSTTSSGTQTTNSAPVVTAINSQNFVYSGIKMSIVEVQQANTFTDDDYIKDGLLRIKLREENVGGNAAYYSYTNAFRLALADGTTVEPEKSEQYGPPAAGVQRTAWIDFPVATNLKPDQMKLLIGMTTEAQMIIPLKGGADLSQYQNKAITPNKAFSYGKTNWTLISAVKQFSYKNTQALKDQVYITVTIKVENPSSDTFYGNARSLLRLKSGDTTKEPEDATLDLTIVAGTNAQGTVTFLMPQNNTDFTLIVMADDLNKISTQSTSDFQIK